MINSIQLEAMLNVTPSEIYEIAQRYRLPFLNVAGEIKIRAKIWRCGRTRFAGDAT
jgi:hypothetical protein